MILFPHYSPQRRVLQAILLHFGPRLFRHVNPANLFLVKRFEGMEIECLICGREARLAFQFLDVRKMRSERNNLFRENLRSSCCNYWMRQRLLAYAMPSECSARLGRQAGSTRGACR